MLLPPMMRIRDDGVPYDADGIEVRRGSPSATSPMTWAADDDSEAGCRGDDEGQEGGAVDEEAGCAAD